MISKRICYLLFPLLFSVSVAKAHRPPFLFSPNKGQWHPDVLYRTSIPGGQMYFERDGITFRYYDQQKLKYIHDHRGEPIVTGDENEISGVTVRTRLLGANTAPQVSEKIFGEFYENWFIGNDVSKHAVNVYPSESVTYADVYPGIDWAWYEKDGFLKFDFRVKAGANTGLIRTRYEGQERLHIDPLGNLITTTGLFITKEEKPLAYQVNKGGDTVRVPCEYRVEGNVVSYAFPEGYDKDLDLVIDPSLIFSSYSGSFADNFGYTATYDSKGFLYSGGNVFDIGYHTTPGAFKVTYGGGQIDCAISKYDTTGHFMIWSTYLGGSGSEMPHSMVVNKLDQLFVFGTTGSPDFPTSTSAYDRTFNGGTPLNQVGVGYIDNNGSDIFVSRFSVNGNALLASTYLGGSANDGLNLAPVMNHNYADLSRGEIDIDNWNYIYLASSTASADFPVTSGAIQHSHGGGAFDGVVLKMDNSLTTLVWSTFLGGSANDAVYSLAVDKQNNIVVTGGTGSSNFPVRGSAFQTHNGGIDAFVTVINSLGTQIMHSILYGTNKYDQAYFVELDNAQNVYLLGQTDATNGFFHTGTGFGIPNGGQFISKFEPDLSAVEWSTSFGNGNGHPDISPTAFLVDVCRKIYLSGWGGSLSGNNLPGSTVVGLPITSDAFQSTPHNNDFYIMVLEDDATALSYATYYGGAQSPEHVDGGTSRFNRKGEIYQSVCAGCGGAQDFPTTPGAWSQVNNGHTAGGAANGCNNGVFKFLLDFPSMVADFEVPPSVCAPATVSFTNYTTGATEFHWDLGNGQTSTDSIPNTTYSQSGVYTVRLVANNTNGTTCNLTDTVIKQIVVLGLDAQDLPDKNLCPGQTAEIGLQPVADPSITYQWVPSTGLSDASVSNPIFNSSAGSRDYRLVISNGNCSDTLLQHVVVAPLTPLTLNDTLVCAGIPFAVGFAAPPAGLTFSWSPTANLSNPNIANPVYTPQGQVTFKIKYANAEGCRDSLERTVNVLNLDLFQPADTAICPGDTVRVHDFPLQPGLTYTWTPTASVSNPNIANPSLYPTATQTYRIVVSNGICADTSEKTVQVLLQMAVAGSDDTLCVGQSVLIGPDNPSSFLAYKWTPGTWLSNPNIANPTATPLTSTSYVLQVHAVGNENSCSSSDTVSLTVNDPGGAGFSFGEFAGCYGIEVKITPNGNPNYGYHWYTSNGQTGSGTHPVFTAPYDSTVIFYMVVTGEGCTDTIAVPKTFGNLATYWGELVVPNIFTPNKDNINDCFGPSGAMEGCYWLYVYNRWGVLVFDSFKLERTCWNGNYMKTHERVTDGVYFWVLEVGTTEYHGTVTVAGGAKQ